MRKSGTRWLTILSGIIDMLFAILVCVFSVLGFVKSLDVDVKVILGTLGLWGLFSFILFSILFIVGIVFLVAGILLIRLGAKTDIDYSERKATVITYVVFDFILLIVLVATGILSSGLLVFALILSALVLISAVFKILDYKIFWHKVKNGKIELKKPATESSKINLEGLDPKFKMSIELKNLEKMQQDKLITTEEFDLMRKQIMEKYTNENLNNKHDSHNEN